MKIRNGFVSNSSSSSFVIAKQAIAEEQIAKLIAYSESEENYDGWSIEEGEWFIEGSTIMDNGSIYKFIETIEMPNGSIFWPEG